MQNRLVIFVFVLFFVVFGCLRSAQALVRHTMDDEELAEVRAASPAAAAAYTAAEARLRAGDWAGAEKLLAKARELRPSSFLLARRHCQVLTELGRRSDAIAACKDAQSGQTAMDERAYVGALMSGNELANAKDLADAVREAANAKRLQGQPFSDAAFCEIAHHIGDDAMYSACLSGLEKNAPGYFETVRWRSARRAVPIGYYWALWSLLAALGVATLAHAFLRWFRAPLPRAPDPRAAAAVLLLLGAAIAKPAHAAEPAAPSPQPHWQLSHFGLNYEDPESRIPTIAERNADPLEFGYFLQDLAAEAVKAERNSDFRKSVKFWRASAKAVPDEAVGFSHACQNYQILNERENALQYCARALNLHGVTADDYLRFSELMVAKPSALVDQEVEDLNAAVKHLRAQPNGAGPAAVIECELGVKLEDEKRLANCTSVLAKTTPNDPHTLTFEWALAMKRHNYGEAQRLLTVMSKTAMVPTALAELRAATDKAAAWWRRPFTDPRYGVGLLLLIGGCVLLVVRKRAQLRSGSAPAAGQASVVS